MLLGRTIAQQTPSSGLSMVDVVEAARVGFGLQIDHLLRNAQFGHVSGNYRVALFVALVRWPRGRRSAVKAEASPCIKMSEGACEPDESAGGIAHCPVAHPGVIAAEANVTPDFYGGRDVSAFGIEDDNCLH